MKAIILNGMNPDDGEPLPTVQAALTALLEDRGWAVKPFILHQRDIAPCQGCFGCWVQTPGRCVLKRGGDEIAEAFVQSDLAILLTPVTFGGWLIRAAMGLPYTRLLVILGSVALVTALAALVLRTRTARDHFRSPR